MSGFIIHERALVTCPHNVGTASPDQVDSRVNVGGQPIMTVIRTYTIRGCPQNTPCSKAAWTRGAQRVKASGLPVAIDSGDSVCVPSGRLLPKIVQRRVTAS